MRQFKKRTLALVLASVVTVVGAFGAENYTNSLMSLKIDSDINNDVMLTLYTKQNYSNEIHVSKQDKNTYIINLPETNNYVDTSHSLKKGIEYINVKTTPYTTYSNGYTSVVIKTSNETKLNIQTALYLPTTQKHEPRFLGMQEGYSNDSSYANKTTQDNAYKSQSSYVNSNLYQPIRKKNNYKNKQELSYFLLIGALIVTLTIFFIIKAKDKMSEIVGEQPDLNLDDEEINQKKEDKKKERKKKQHKKSQTKTLRVAKPTPQVVTAPIIENSDFEEKEEQEETQSVVVDLDELLNEQNNKDKNSTLNKTKADDFSSSDDNEENKALEEFLSSYNFDNEEQIEQEEEKEEDKHLYNEELYETCINSTNLSFTKDDLEKIKTLLNLEIGDETKKHALQHLESSSKSKKPTPKELLENFVTLFTVQQNITFTRDDISALNKLMTVEIDKNFLTDLKTNPKTIKAMQTEIMKHSTKPHNTSELLTLKVKDMLPDLSLAMKKQGGKRIESEAKAEVVYYSEGYEYTKLNTNIKLPDLAKEVNNDKAYKPRPSDKFKYVDDQYDVKTISIKDELPDLQDALKNPEKYETPKPEPEVVDEDALLKSITNVTFKPFDDGSRKFEVINDVPDSNTPSVNDIQEEFNQFSNNNFKIMPEEQYYKSNISENDDFENLYNNNYFDLDNNKNILQSTNKANDSDNDILEEYWKNTHAEELEQEDDELLKSLNILDQQEDEIVPQESSKQEIEETSIVLPKKEKAVNNNHIEKIEGAPEVCILDNEKFTIVSTSEFTDKMGCYLAKNSNGYCIIGYVGDSIFRIKHYEKLNVEKLKSRITEKLDDGTIRYIVRIGIHKFVMHVKKNDMEFVMDLC